MTVVSGLQRFLRWVFSGYYWPLHKDWLAWVGLAIVCVVSVFRVRSEGAWVLLGAPIGFAVYGWLLGAARNFVRGYRDDEAAGIETTRALPRR
jgi:hypothetical protein